jgi:hypothetical protein
MCLIAALAQAAAATSPEALRYCGCVTDGGGRAIAGAVVEAYRYPEQGRNPNPEVVTNVTTGADGKFEVVVPAFSRLVVRKPGMAPAWRELNPYRTNNAPIALSPPTTLAGVVVDQAGGPVREAEVFVSAAHTGDKADRTTFLGGKLTRQLFSSHTDANGHFQIENFPGNSMAELGVSTPGKVLPPRWVGYSPEGLPCRSGQHDIRLVVETPAQIEGRIETETGEPPTNAWVELRPIRPSFAVPWEPVRGVTNGAFRFNGLAAGAYQVFAHFGTNEPPDWVAEPVPVAVQSGQNLQDIEIRAIKGGILRVRSRDKRSGKPVEQVYLTVRTGSDYLHQTSDSNGLALFRLLPGRHNLHGLKEGLRPQGAEVGVDASQTNEASLEFSSPPVISGIVRDSSGRPSPGLSIRLDPRGLDKEIKTDVNGRYEVVKSEDPQVVLVADAVHHAAVSRELEEGVTNLDLQLAPALTVIGRVQDSQGRAIPKADAQVYLNSGKWGFPVYWQQVATDAQGCFEIVNLPADRTYYVNFGAKGYGSAQKQVPAEDGNQVEMPPTVLKEANLELMGRVVDSSQTPVADARLRR